MISDHNNLNESKNSSDNLKFDYILLKLSEEELIKEKWNYSSNKNRYLKLLTWLCFL